MGRGPAAPTTAATASSSHGPSALAQAASVAMSDSAADPRFACTRHRTAPALADGSAACLVCRRSFRVEEWMHKCEVCGHQECIVCNLQCSVAAAHSVEGS